LELKNLMAGDQKQDEGSVFKKRVKLNHDIPSCVTVQINNTC
jgi:hypothetical protein